MKLAWYDLAGHGRRRLYVLPRLEGEPRADYARRFFREVEGLGHAGIALGGKRYSRTVRRRGW